MYFQQFEDLGDNTSDNYDRNYFILRDNDNSNETELFHFDTPFGFEAAKQLVDILNEYSFFNPMVMAGTLVCDDTFALIVKDAEGAFVIEAGYDVKDLDELERMAMCYFASVEYEQKHDDGGEDEMTADAAKK